MGEIVRDHTYIDGKAARASHANENENKLFAEINGNLDWYNIDDDLINQSLGFLKLDGSARVLLAQIPDTLTGKDADTLDTKHYSDIATEIDEDIATHKGDASAHHAKTTDHGALDGLGDDDHIQYLKKSGGTMVGALILHGAPTLDLHAATKKYVDDMGGAGVTDHGALTGLGDDDHAHYYNQARGDARYLRSGVNLDIGAHTLEAIGFTIDNVDVRLDGATEGGVPVLRCTNKAYDAYVPLSVYSLHIEENNMWFSGQHHELKGLADDDHPQYLKKVPDYESAWTSIDNNTEGTFTHDLGTSDILAQVLVKYSGNVFQYSTCGIVGDDRWVYYYTDNSLVVRNGIGDTAEFKVQVWKIGS